MKPVVKSFPGARGRKNDGWDCGRPLKRLGGLQNPAEPVGLRRILHKC